MNRKLITISFLIIGILIIHLLKVPFEELLGVFGIDNHINKIISSTLPRIGILIFSIWYILKHPNLKQLTSLCTPYKLNNPHLLLIPLIICGLATVENIVDIIDRDNKLILLYIIENIFIGFSEEFMFRGILILLFLLIFIHNKYQGIYAVLVSSILFGLIHFMNYFRIENIEEVSSQVIFAFGIGCFFGGLFLKTGNIYAVSLLHFLYNVGFTKMPIHNQEVSTVIEQTESLTSIIFGWLVLIVLIFSGLYMSKSTKYPINY